MKLIKCLRHALNMVLNSKLRSWLTIIGIVIGVASVIAIVSMGQGMKSEMESQMGALGGDILTVSAGFSRGGGMFGHGGPGGGGGSATEEEVVLGKTDLQALRGIPDLAYIDTQIRGNVEVSYLGKKGSVSLTGVDQKSWAHITTEQIDKGRLLDSADQNVIVIGGRLADGYFDQPLGLNQMLTIEGSNYRVVGILDDDRTSIYMPISMAYQVLDDKERDVYDSIVLKVKDENYLDEAIAAVEKKLMLVRHVNEKEKDFTVSSSKQMQETRSEMMSSMQIFLTAIAAVSLLVGAVGIANTMFTSVLEKTKQIGIMKAIGARNRDIMMIFLLNAGLIGLVGGILGAVFGTSLSAALPSLLGGTPMSRGGTAVTVQIIIVALAVSVLVGMIAGAIPAYKASKLKPVDALRYE
ncbi:ABC transporter permease [Candidatus Woesearchaeota archaeon]|nr:ABC transporter permease [Candidatus Woesearchaeota archaeon]